ncbi:MAG: type II secretion system F family protein [Planctomycetota bacterium]
MADSRINLYHNLSVMLNAGMPIIRAFQTVQKQGRYGRLFREIEQDVSQNVCGVADAVEARRKKFKKLDVTLIRVGEETGQLAEMFGELSQWYTFRQRMRRTFKAGMALPVVYIHVAAFIFPVIPCAFSGFDIQVYFKTMKAILAAFYIPAGVILGIIYLTPKTGPLRWLLDTFVMIVPLLGKAIRELELSRYCKVFSITYRAGVPIIQCTKMATDTVSNRVMHQRLRGAYEKVLVGDEMSTGFSPALPAEFIALWEVGEESGELDQSTWRLGDMHAQNAEFKFNLIAEWVPRLIYFIILGLLVYAVIYAISMIASSYQSVM